MSALSRFPVVARLRTFFLLLEFRPAKKANQLKDLCLLLLDAELRLLIPGLLQSGEDEDLDGLIWYVTLQLAGIPSGPKLERFASEDMVFQLVGLAQKSSDIQSVISRYHAAGAFLAGLGVEKGRGGQLVLTTPEVPGLGPVNQELRQTRARYVSLRKQLAERSALKIEFSVAGISGSIALITAIFVVSGFLYVHYFYRQMGVEVSNYFSAADYLAASVEQIRAGAIAAAMSLVTFSAGVLSGTRRSRSQIKAEARDRTRRRWFWMVTTVIAIGVSGVSLYMDKPNVGLMRATGFLLCFWIAEYLSDTFFSNPLAAMTALVGTLLFGVNVGFSAYERSQLLLHGNEDAAYVQKLVYKDSSPSIPGELYGANSSYYFVYDRSKKLTHVVPRDRVAQIDIALNEKNKEALEAKNQGSKLTSKILGPDQGF